MTGTATGPHLHFGVYYVSGAGPVDPYGWSGSYPDPYAKDLGDLWLTGSPRYPQVQMPSVTVSAATRVDDPYSIDVTWSSPGDMAFTIYAVTRDGVETTWIERRGNGSATFHGRPGQGYWFWATAASGLGWTDSAGSPVIVLPHRSPGAIAA
jgi:hypothetical protein